MTPVFAPLPASLSSRTLRWWHWLPAALLLCAALAAFAPIAPRMPEAAIDPSWMLAMNQAVDQGLVFGRDIVFTFGPYSTLYTQAYHPATYSLALAWGALLGLGYASLLLLAVAPAQRMWLWALAGSLLLIDSRDTLFFFYPVLVLLVAWQATRAPADAAPVPLVGGRAATFAGALALLGLLPVVKGSFLPLSVAAALAAVALFWLAGRWRFARLCLLLPLATLVAAWCLAGQPLDALPDYFVAMAPIVSGFTEAMALYPSTTEWRVMRVGVPGMIGGYLLIAGLVLWALWRSGRGASRLRTALLLGPVALYLFVAFKAGFVRHDGHALASASALVLLVLALRALGLARVHRAVALGALVVWAFTHDVYVGLALEDAPLASLISLSKRLAAGPHGGTLQDAYAQALQKIQVQVPMGRLTGGTDIYPHDVAALIASGNRWAPRPVPQSYSAYTPALARLNDAHLQGAQAPEHVVFRLGAIDLRYPSLEDGPSWPTLLSHYTVADQDLRYIYLQKQEMPLVQHKALVLQAMAQAGVPVELPADAGILYAQVDLEPTALGRLLTVAYKPEPVFVTVDLVNGQSFRYRLVPGMARAGFVLSPLVQSNADFVRLAHGARAAPVPRAARAALLSKRVLRLRIGPAQATSMQWSRVYTLRVWALGFSSARVAQQ